MKLDRLIGILLIFLHQYIKKQIESFYITAEQYRKQSDTALVII